MLGELCRVPEQKLVRNFSSVDSLPNLDCEVQSNSMLCRFSWTSGFSCGGSVLKTPDSAPKDTLCCGMSYARALVSSQFS